MQSFNVERLSDALTASPLRRYALAALAALLVVLALAFFVHSSRASAKEGGLPPSATAVIGDIESTVLASATLQAANQVNVGAQASGLVRSLKVVLGQQVKEGQLIAEIDAAAQNIEQRNAAAGLRSLEAQMRAKQVALQLAESTFRRQKQLFEQDAGARADYESAEAARTMARADAIAFEAQIEQARIQADKVEVDLGRTMIRAPISGTVVAIVTKEGQTLNAVQQVPTVVRLARLDTLQVKAQISEVDVARVKAGQRVYFTLLGEPGRRYHSRLQVVEPVPDAAGAEGGGGASPGTAVYYNALFSVKNPDGRLRIGMSAQVTIVLARAQHVVTVPLGALGERRANGRYMVQVQKNGRTRTREVQAGVRDTQNVQIVKGLKAGEQVLLHDGPPDGGAGEAA